MSKVSLVFSTLYPENLDIQRSCNNTIRLIKEWRDEYRGKCGLRIIAGSAHKDSVDRMNRVMRDTDEEIWEKSDIFHCPFVLEHNMTERRGHEISFSKQYIFRQLMNYKFDYVYSADSDVYISFRGVWKYLQKLKECPGCCVQFPYTLRNTLSISPDQFGVYLLPKKMLTEDHASVIYETALNEKGHMRRKGAPDCRLIKRIKRNGNKVIRASDIRSWHYDEKVTYIYDKGKCLKEKRTDI